MPIPKIEIRRLMPVIKEHVDAGKLQHAGFHSHAQLGEVLQGAICDMDELARITKVHPADDYHEGLGDVLWWALPVTEAPYVGSPLQADWPGYHTHWTPVPTPCI